MNFVTQLLISANEKSKSYDFILIIVDALKKMVHYMSVKTIINALSYAKSIMNVVIRGHGIAGYTISNHESVFISKF